VISIRLFRIISTPSKTFFLSAKPRDFDVSMYTTKTPIEKWRFNVTELKEIFAFSVKDRSIKLFYLYQRLQCTDNYFFKIKFASFFIYCCQHRERKTICLDIFLLSDRQWGTEHQYFLSRFLGVSILQLLIIYRIYNYDMLTLSQ